MIKMFVLLINEINLIALALLLFFFIFTSEVLPHRGLLHTIFYIAYLRICRGYLPQEIALGICRGYMSLVFCIRKQIFFYICEQILFIWKQTFFICEQNFLICEIFFINSVSFCYCRGSYGPP